jgi:hypothetical protein
MFRLKNIKILAIIYKKGVNMFTKDSILEKISKGITEIAFSKRKIDPVKILKKTGFKLKKESNSSAYVAFGTDGNVFDSMFVGTNANNSKIIILYKKKKSEPYLLLLDTTKNEDLVSLISDLNKNNIKELKNKSMEHTYLFDNMIKFLRF